VRTWTAVCLYYWRPDANRRRFELVWGKDKIDAVEASIRIVRHVAETYLTDEEAEPFTNQNTGLIRRLEKASNRNIQDLAGFKSALHEYNETILGLVEDGVIAKNLDNMHEIPRNLVAFILDQVYDRTVAPKVELLSKYENGTDYVYGGNWMRKLGLRDDGERLQPGRRTGQGVHLAMHPLGRASGQGSPRAWRLSQERRHP